MLSAMVMTKVASRRIRRSSPMWALSNTMRPAASTQAGKEYPDSTKGQVRHIVFDVRVADILEQEATIKSNQPSHKSKQEFSEGRVNVEEIGALEVV